MSFGQGNAALWADIQNIYTTVNETRAKFYLGETNIPDRQDTLATVEDIQDLQDIIQALTANNYIAGRADTSSVVIPTRGDLLRYNPLQELKEIADEAYNSCDFSSFSFSCPSFNFCPGFRATFAFEGSYTGGGTWFEGRFCPTFYSSEFHNSAFRDFSFTGTYQQTGCSSFVPGTNASTFNVSGFNSTGFNGTTFRSTGFNGTTFRSTGFNSSFHDSSFRDFSFSGSYNNSTSFRSFSFTGSYTR